MPVRPLRFAATLAVALAVLLPTAPSSPSFSTAPSAVAAAPAAPVKPVHRPTVPHGTLTNRHVRTVPSKAAPTPPTVRRSAAAPHKTTIHRSRSRRAAHAHRTHRSHRHGSIAGDVRNAAGDPVANASVSVGAGRGRHGHARRSRRTYTDNGGHYTIRGVAAGRHKVTASKSGVGKAARAVQIRAGASRIGFDLKIGAKHKQRRHRK